MFSKKKRQQGIGDILEHLGFAEALEHSLGEKECKCLLFTTTTLCEFNQSLLSPISSPLLFKTKKGEMDFGCAVFMAFFLLRVNRLWRLR
jgi:hypothetical protein